MAKTLIKHANRCHEDFGIMVRSMERTTVKLHRRFTVEVVLATGKILPLAGSNALDLKFGEYLDRARTKLLEKQRQLGINHVDYSSLLASLPPANRKDTENPITIRAWSVAKGPFLEALCLLADVRDRRSPAASTPLRLFAPLGVARSGRGAVGRWRA